MRILDLCVVVGLFVIQILMIINIGAYLIKQWYNWKTGIDSGIDYPNSPFDISACRHQKIHDVTETTTTNDDNLNNLIIVMGDKSWKVIKKGSMNIDGIDPNLDRFNLD